jgi:diaminopimelate decarboxylase
VSLRFNPNVSAKTHPYISTGLKKNKFGLEEKEIIEVVKHCDRLRGIRMKGLSIHIGSQILELSALEMSFKKIAELCLKLNGILELKKQKPIQLVDLGGGIGIPYRPSEKAIAIEQYTRTVQKIFGSWMGPPITLGFEPGRVLVGNAGILLTELLYKKSRGKKKFWIVDAGMNDLMRPSLYGSFHEIASIVKGSKTEKNIDIVGPVCESSDFLGLSREIREPHSDFPFLAVMSAGAYGMSMASQYNSRNRPAEVLVSGDQWHLIRRRDELEDHWEQEIIPWDLEQEG